jgi:hypothetical protein
MLDRKRRRLSKTLSDRMDFQVDDEREKAMPFAFFALA